MPYGFLGNLPDVMMQNANFSVTWEVNVTQSSQRSNAKTTSHPVVSALIICISSKRLRSEVRKKALLEIQ